MLVHDVSKTDSDLLQALRVAVLDTGDIGRARELLDLIDLRHQWFAARRSPEDLRVVIAREGLDGVASALDA